MATSSLKHALVVEGGAMRGIFATGVLDAWLAANYQPFDMYFGVSAGATNIAAFLCAQHGRNYKVITDYSCRPEFISYGRFIRGGHLFDLDWLWHKTISEIRLDLATFASQSAPFYVVATNVHNARAEYIQGTAENLEQVLKASCALPLAYRDYPEYQGQFYTDGGIGDSIPVRQAYAMGARKITVILSQPLGYRKKPAKFNWLTQRLLKNTPALAKSMTNRWADYNASLDFIMQPPGDCEIDIIAPPTEFDISRTTRDLAKLDAGYAMGQKAAQAFISAP
ncbi:patatin-like phospholipase family protein [Pseudoalteromonas sp. T1lg22]|uniref:patatin-like phospholipase family protein n=1 Tax=Pseudoalteromonas sp. T1lg22 TaxID=2077096 RepID=UPI000CF702CF|nr:patatin family protein [Pseudoalteromonas sp. T1lg22]